MQEDVIHLTTIRKYNDLYGFPTTNPWVTVCDLKESTKMPKFKKVNYGVYAIFIKHGANCTLIYGRQKCDYQKGTIVCFAPGQVTDKVPGPIVLHPDVYALVFKLDALYGTPWASKIKEYTFFDYDQKEALHLSESEQESIINLFNEIKANIKKPLALQSKAHIADLIGNVMENCLKFYSRQLETRKELYSGVLENFEKQLKNYFIENKAEREGLPTVKYFADKACLSPGYFGDLIKKETGTSAKKYVQDYIIRMAKTYLSERKLNISEIAYKLGFQYPQHFTRFFKQQSGCTPKDFRRLSLG